MADDKTKSDIDDWLEDLDDSDELSEELDQANIDALLSESKDVSAKDQETEEGEGAADSIVELDQSNIDDLLGEMDESPAEQSASGETDEEDDGELSQDNIDELLGDMNNSTLEKAEDQQASADEEEGDVDLEQANIDLLLDGEADDVPVAAEGDVSDLDQDNIDALLGIGSAADEVGEASGDNTLLEESSPEETGGLDVDQDEIDKLFADLDDDEEEDLFAAEDMDFADALGKDDDDFADFAGSTDGDETAADSGEEIVGILAGTATGTGGKMAKEEKKAGVLPFLPEAINKTVASVIVACLILVIGLGLFFFSSDGEEELQVPLPLSEEERLALEESVMDDGAKIVAKNSVPTVRAGSYQMPVGGGEVPILLAGQDEDHDELSFQVTKEPGYGRLSGEKGSFVYLPNTDFPGEDRFEFTASDGKETSNPATVLITGPNMVEIAARQEEGKKIEKAFLPKTPAVVAANETFRTSSTDNVTIDWAKIWSRNNATPFNEKIYVDVDSGRLKGTLTKTDKAVSYYRPDPFFAGTETIPYRFKSGGLSSGRGVLTLEVELGSPAPEIRISSMKKGYLVGQTVVIDALATRDEARESLSFTWEQVSGVPVPLQVMNEESSMISFTMPSSFYSEPEPGPVLRLTTLDETGKSDVKDIKIRTISRRTAALWRGVNGGVADDPDFDSRRLPWPYRD